MTDLGRRMAKGAAWLVLFRLLERGIGVVSTLILARLLVPGDFGLVAMATSFLAGLELLGAFSFDLALIQNQHAERRHYDTAWTFGVVFGLAKTALMCVLAIPAAHFFREPRVEGVMYVLAACTLLESFSNIGIVDFQKRLELHKEFTLGLAKKLVGFVVTIALAFALHSHWALVSGVFAIRLTGLVLSYGMHPYRPRLSWSAAGELLNYSKWLLLNNVLIFLNNRGTDFIIGRLSGARALGLYSVAYEVANLPTTELVFPISRALLPGYAMLSGDVVRLREAFLKAIGLIVLLTLPAGALIGVAAEPVVRVLLGEKWLDTVPLISVLALFGIVRSIHGPTGTIYLAVGKPRIVALLQCVQLGLALTLMLFLIPLQGPKGAAWSILVAATCAMTVNYIMVTRELSLSVGDLVSAAWRPVTGSLLMAFVVFMTEAHLPSTESFSAAVGNLTICLITGIFTYGATVLSCWFFAGRPRGAESALIDVVMARLRSSRVGRAVCLWI